MVAKQQVFLKRSLDHKNKSCIGETGRLIELETAFFIAINGHHEFKWNGRFSMTLKGGATIFTNQ